MNNVYYLENHELKEHLIDHGILHEVNRTFFHPIGMALTLYHFEESERTHLLLQKTDDDEGFIFEEIEKDKQDKFRNFANERYEKRQDEVGFVIQTHSINEYKKEVKKEIVFKTERLKLILMHLQEFFHSVHFQFLKKTDKFDDNTFFANIDYLKIKMHGAYADGNWADVAAYAFLIHCHDKLENEINKLVKEVYPNE